MPELHQSTDALDLEQLFSFVVALRGGDFSARLPTDGAARRIPRRL